MKSQPAPETKSKRPARAYRVYLNKHPHLPDKAGHRLFFESHCFDEALRFSQKLVGNGVEWLVEDIRFYGLHACEAVKTFRKLVEHLWIEPVGGDGELPQPFCAKRHAFELLQPHPAILVHVAPHLLDGDQDTPSPSTLDKSSPLGILRAPYAYRRYPP
ncbi:MAG: hypothetical protein ACKOAS_04020 [Verrucomicrobiota bacterium]